MDGQKRTPQNIKSVQLRSLRNECLHIGKHNNHTIKHKSVRPVMKALETANGEQAMTLGAQARHKQGPDSTTWWRNKTLLCPTYSCGLSADPRSKEYTHAAQRGVCQIWGTGARSHPLSRVRGEGWTK